MRRAFWVWGAFGVWGAALSGCVRSSEAFVEIALDVAVALPGGETPDAPMELQALGGLCGDPGLTYPRCEIARQPLGAGEAAEGWLVRVPQEVAELDAFDRRLMVRVSLPNPPFPLCSRRVSRHTTPTVF